MPAGVISLDYGDNQTFTITPDTGYHVADVLVDGVSIGTVTSYDFTSVTANHTIAVTFAVNDFTINASVSGGHGVGGSGQPGRELQWLGLYQHLPG